MQSLIHDSIARAAQKRPGRVAFRCQAQEITYHDLDHLTDQLAQHLQNCHLQQGDRVGILMDRHIQSPIAVYAILKAGGVYVPLDASAPASRIEHVIQDTEMKILITSPRQKFTLRRINFDDLAINHLVGADMEEVECTSWEAIGLIDHIDLNSDLEATDPAYIIYTSGSTGTPKGIVHTHASGLSYARLTADTYGLTHSDIIANHSPLHFDMSTLGYLTSPYVGATCAMISDGESKFPVSLAKWLQEERVTIWYAVPLALIQLRASGAMDEYDYHRLRWILYGGEPFPAHEITQLMPHFPSATWSNIYGPAEVNQCTYYNFSTWGDPSAPIPLGNVWDETHGIIVNDQDQLDTIGELLISSTTMMQGYWNDPARTSRSIQERNIGDYRLRYYRTGDMVELRDELLYYLGRMDRQVKIRGYRVELEEIEQHAMSVDGVEAVVAFVGKPVRDHETHGARLSPDSKHICLAYIDTAGQDRKRELKDLLMDKVPNYAVPTEYHRMDSIPRTSAGKVDYAALQSLSTTS